MSKIDQNKSPVPIFVYFAIRILLSTKQQCGSINVHSKSVYGQMIGSFIALYCNMGWYPYKIKHYIQLMKPIKVWKNPMN